LKRLQKQFWAGRNVEVKELKYPDTGKNPFPGPEKTKEYMANGKGFEISTNISPEATPPVDNLS
jgi:hypothetical protein